MFIQANISSSAVRVRLFRQSAAIASGRFVCVQLQDLGPFFRAENISHPIARSSGRCARATYSISSAIQKE